MRLGLALFVAVVLAGAAATRPPENRPLRFVVSVADGLLRGPTDGRIFVVLGKGREEPRQTIGNTEADAPPCLGADGLGFQAGKTVELNEASAIYPLESLKGLAPGDYNVQAVFAWNRALLLPNAPGNLYSKPKVLSLDALQSGVIKLELTETEPVEKLPDDTQTLRYLKFRSEKLSAFHGREMFLRAGIALPLDFEKDVNRKYPLRVHIGGFGTRYTAVRRLQPQRGDPAFVLLHLDGAGPYGDPYQVNSANNGPYGDALTQELIPHVEKHFRCVGQPQARVLDGASTGGWVSLALQIFYPDYFNGAWSHCPDSVDFRAHELINLYADTNVFTNRYQHERPSSRTVDGDVRTTVRSEIRIERVLGMGNRWELSGKDWASWNATFGPRGADKHPVPAWDGQSGRIDRAVANHYRGYDLRLVLEQNWKTLAPRLHGKLNIWVGEADDYFLNNAVHLLDDFLTGQREPKLDYRITFGSGRKGHGWRGLSDEALWKQMAARVEPPR